MLLYWLLAFEVYVNTEDVIIKCVINNWVQCYTNIWLIYLFLIISCNCGNNLVIIKEWNKKKDARHVCVCIESYYEKLQKQWKHIKLGWSPCQHWRCQVRNSVFLYYTECSIKWRNENNVNNRIYKINLWIKICAQNGNKKNRSHENIEKSDYSYIYLLNYAISCGDYIHWRVMIGYNRF